jgi:tetratricopeptide (TPR) repeat protein
MELYPDFPFAHFEAAMVFIARGSLDRAESLLREGTIAQDRQAHLRQRFPARGLHWLLGLVRLAHGDVEEADTEFGREVAGGAGQLYGAEFAMNAHDGAGFARLRRGDLKEAEQQFRRALELFPAHARSLVGLGAALAAANRPKGAAEAFARASTAIEGLRRGGRASAATMTEAFLRVTMGRHAEAVQCLRSLLEHPEPPFAGWTIPVEPLLEPVRRLPDFQHVLDTLSARAR